MAKKPRVRPKPKPRDKAGRQRGHGRRGRGNYTGQVPGGRGGRYIEGDKGRPEFEPNPPPGGAPPPPPPGGDAGFIGIPGLPADVQARANELLKDDPTGESALAYIRTTEWYKHEYDGIQYGVAKGFFDAAHPEAAYREYKNRVDQIQRRYYGRGVTNIDISAYLSAGYDPDTLDKMGAGYADIQANRQNYQFYAGNFGGGRLTEEELAMLGRQNAGLGSTMGERIRGKIDEAIKRYERVFQGTLGSSASLEASIGDTLQRRRTSDIGY